MHATRLEYMHELKLMYALSVYHALLCRYLQLERLMHQKLLMPYLSLTVR